MATDPNPLNSYGLVIVPRVAPNSGDSSGKLIARLGLLEFLNIEAADSQGVSWSDPFTKAAHNRQLYPGGPLIPVKQSVSMVVSVGGVNSLLSGESWSLVIDGQEFGIRLLELRARDVVDFLKTNSNLNIGDFLRSPRGRPYPIKTGPAAPTTFGAAGTDFLGLTPGAPATEPPMAV